MCQINGSWKNRYIANVGQKMGMLDSSEVRTELTGNFSNGGVVVPPIIPFPPPPPGFIPPPAGIPHPKDPNSCPEDFTDTHCKDCKATSNWCSDGPQAGCPCRDECPADDSDGVPSCSDSSCEGESGKCTTVSSSTHILAL
jgi:hypothetical protein